MRKQHLIYLLPFLSILNGCGGGGDSDSQDNNQDTSTGIFVDSPVANLNYRTNSQSGRTNSEGEYLYLPGEMVTFSIGGIDLPSVLGQDVVTPFDLVGTSDIDDQSVVNILRLLQSLDTDGNPDNGILIADEAHTTAEGMSLSFSSTNFEAETVNLIANSGSVTTTIVSTESAQDHFEDTLSDLLGETPDDETGDDSSDNDTDGSDEPDDDSGSGNDAGDNDVPTDTTTTLTASGSWISSGGVDAQSADNVTYSLIVEEGTSSTRINLQSSSVDTYLFLLDESGATIATNDDFNGSLLQSELSLDLEAGEYFVVAATFSQGVSGSFTLTAEGNLTSLTLVEQDDSNDTEEETVDLSLSGSWNVSGGTNSLSGDNPKYKFVVNESDSASLITMTLESQTVDTFLFLLDQSQNLLAYNDDYLGSLRTSQITAELAAGEYYLVAATYFEGVSGDYTISVNGNIDTLSVASDSGTDNGSGTVNDGDFTKISSSGTDLPSDASEWSCVRDNVTGLVWEVKTRSGVNSFNNLYRWGGTGAEDEGSEFYDDWNELVTGSTGLCGFSDWRVPNEEELFSASLSGTRERSLMTDYFPYYLSSYWSSDAHKEENDSGILVYFSDARVISPSLRSRLNHVRLVRGQ